MKGRRQGDPIVKEPCQGPLVGRTLGAGGLEGHIHAQKQAWSDQQQNFPCLNHSAELSEMACLVKFINSNLTL